MAFLGKQVNIVLENMKDIILLGQRQLRPIPAGADTGSKDRAATLTVAATV